LIMARGPKHHLKRLQANKNWHLSKMKGIYAPRPLPGPHRSSECVPLLVLIRNLMQRASTAKEAKIICERGHILVNGKPRTDVHFPAGLFDVITLPSMNKSYRLIYDVSGNWALVDPSFSETKKKYPLPQEVLADPSSSPSSCFSAPSKPSPQSSKTKKDDKVNTKKAKKAAKTITPLSSAFESIVPMKVLSRGLGHKKMVGTNTYAVKTSENHLEARIPWCTTYTGETLRYVDKEINKNDTVFVKITSKPIQCPKKFQKYNFSTSKEIVSFFKLEVGNTVMVIRGKNKGRVGKINFIEKHLKTSNVVFVKDEIGNEFVTKEDNIMVIGGKESEIGLKNGRGVRMSLKEKVEWGLKDRDKKKEHDG